MFASRTIPGINLTEHTKMSAERAGIMADLVGSASCNGATLSPSRREELAREWLKHLPPCAPSAIDRKCVTVEDVTAAIDFLDQQREAFGLAPCPKLAQPTVFSVGPETDGLGGHWILRFISFSESVFEQFSGLSPEHSAAMRRSLLVHYYAHASATLLIPIKGTNQIPALNELVFGVVRSVPGHQECLWRAIEEYASSTLEDRWLRSQGISPTVFRENFVVEPLSNAGVDRKRFFALLAVVNEIGSGSDVSAIRITKAATSKISGSSVRKVREFSLSDGTQKKCEVRYSRMNHALDQFATEILPSHSVESAKRELQNRAIRSQATSSPEPFASLFDKERLDHKTSKFISLLSPPIRDKHDRDFSCRGLTCAELLLLLYVECGRLPRRKCDECRGILREIQANITPVGICDAAGIPRKRRPGES